MSCVKHQTTCASGGIGRLAGFRCQCSQGRAGSTPASRTRQAPASKRSWGLRFARKPWGAMTEGTASLPCLFLIFYTNAQKKARKYHIRQSNITREVTQYAGLPPRCCPPLSDCKSKRQWLDLPHCVLPPLCVDTQASWFDPLPIRPAFGRKDPVRSTGPLRLRSYALMA